MPYMLHQRMDIHTGEPIDRRQKGTRTGCHGFASTVPIKHIRENEGLQVVVSEGLIRLRSNKVLFLFLPFLSLYNASGPIGPHEPPNLRVR